jgi:hypothetical protein
LDEKTLTPGTLAELFRLQTTRLKAFGDIEGKKVDLSELNIEWKSSVPVLVRVYSGGLVQKYYETPKDVMVTASVFNSNVSAEAKVAASKQASKDTETDLKKVDVSQDKMIREQATTPK